MILTCKTGLLNPMGPRVCRRIAFWAVVQDFRPLLHLLWGSMFSVFYVVGTIPQGWKEHHDGTSWKNFRAPLDQTMWYWPPCGILV